MEYCLVTNKLNKRYRWVKALEDLMVHLPRGSIYGLVGPNGSGKTTLLRVIGGLQEPTSGSYTLFGTENTAPIINQIRRRIGFLVETPSFYRNMTVEENMNMQYRMLGIPDHGRSLEILDMTGLGEAGKIRAGKLSLGMRQRLGIALSLTGNPDALFLDEPFCSLDPQGIIDIRELLLRLNKERQVTILISSHSLAVLSCLASHYGFMRKGRILAEMTAKELEEDSNKSILVRVSDMRSFSPVLDELGLGYQILSACQARIFGEVNLSQLVWRAAERGCEIVDVSHCDESLESFYIRMLGGDGEVDTVEKQKPGEAEAKMAGTE